MKLTREQIVRAALRVLDQVGLHGLTLRRIATELDVQAPALYWHVKNKEQLLDELATSMINDAFASAELSAGNRDWREALRVAADFLRSTMLAHRDGAKVISGTYYHGGALAPDQLSLPPLREAGFDNHTASDVLMSVYHYTVGFVIEEQEVFPVPGQRDPRYEPAALRAHGALLDPGMLEYQFSAGTANRRFRSGVQLLIDGAAARLPR